MEFQANIQEVKDIIEKIVKYVKSNNAFNEGDKEMVIFFTEQLTGIISGAGELLKAVLKGHQDSLDQYTDFIDSAKGVVPQIANLLEKDKNERGGKLKKELEDAFNDCMEKFSLELKKGSPQ